MVKAIRIYYTTFDEEKHKAIIEKLKKTIGIEPIEHFSSIKEFRYLELKINNEDDSLKDIVKEEIKKILGEEAYIRIDYINV